jgi:chromosome segregation ATPase
LIGEVKEWKDKAEEYQKDNQRLYQRLTGTYQAQTDVPAELATRLNKMERENQGLRSEITELKEKVGEVGRENLMLFEENTGKSRKLKGANKKVKNAKDVAGKEEAKAKGAVHEKIQRQAAERKMKLERNEALAELQEYKKMSEDLGAELKIERVGRPHLREDGVEEDYTTVVIPVEFRIHRGDFRKLAMILDSNQMKIIDGFKKW